MSGPVAIARAPGAPRFVTPLELLFDVVYVFAFSELSHHLVAHFDVRTGAETAVMALAVMYAWFMAAWGMNWLEPGRRPASLLAIGMMFASLLMSVSIAGAFGSRAWLFVTGYLLLQVGRAGFLIVALRGRALSAHFANDLVWELGAGALWIAGIFVDGDARLVLWSLAVVVTQVGVWSLHRLPGRRRAIDIDRTGVAAEHLIERFRLFFIIALGESILISGSAIVAADVLTLGHLAALSVAFAGTIALWWCYFERVEVTAVGAAEAAEDAGALGLRGTWTLVLIVLGVLAIAVGDELAIAHPDAGATLGSSLLIFGGPALFLLAQTLFLSRTVAHFSPSRVVALGVLPALAIVTAPLSLIAAITAATAVLVAVAAADTFAANGGRTPVVSRS